MESNLKFYSIGIVVETKPENTDYILVSPIEELNIQTPGNIKEYNKDFKSDDKGLKATNFKTEHESKNYIRAKWLPISNSNRITAPDVVVNETVILFKFGNVDEYYWTTLFREPNLRRLEKVLYSFSDLNSGITKVAFDKNSSYWVEVSTKDKYIHLHTSTSDGEPYGYDIIIDTKTGFINLKDTSGNFIELNSPNNTITLKANKAINIDAPTVNIISSNGVVSFNSNGVFMGGSKILNTTIPGEVNSIVNLTNIDKSNSIGNSSIKRHHNQDKVKINRESRDINNIGVFTNSNQEVHKISNSVSYSTNSLTYSSISFNISSSTASMSSSGGGLNVQSSSTVINSSSIRAITSSFTSTVNIVVG